MGLVYLAEDPSLNRQVAIKMLDIAADSDSDRDFLRSRLLRDARAAAILSHPNVIGIYDIIEEGESVFVVMEYIEGESLASYLDRIPVPDHSFTVQVLRQMAAGLDYTHSKGVIHRDIKPGNVMIGSGTGVKLLDFGIARMNDGRTNTPTGMVMGTVDYMAPEQVKGAAVDGKADQFALAAVAYRMLAGSTLFGRHTLATLAYKLVNEAPQPVRERNADVPAEVDHVLAKALSKSPEDRYPTCSAFVVDLGQALFGTVPTMAMPVGALNPQMTPPAARPMTAGVTARTPAGDGAVSGRKSKVGAMLAAGALVAVAAGALGIWKPWESPKPAAKENIPPTEQTTAKSPEPPPAVKTPEVKTPEVKTEVLPQPDNKTGKEKTADTQTADKKTQGKVTAPEKTTSQKQKTPPPKTDTKTAVKQPPSKAVDQSVAVTPPPPPPPTKEPEKTVVVEPPPDSRPTEIATNNSAESRETPFARGVEQSKKRDYQGAIGSFSEVINRHPKNVLAYFNRGYAFQMTGHLENAVADYTQAIQMGTRDARVFANKAVCEVRLRMDDVAMGDFNRAIEIEPGYANALNGRGGVYYRRHQFRLAIQDYTAAINANPEFIQAYENRAMARDAAHEPGAEDDRKAARRLQHR